MFDPFQIKKAPQTGQTQSGSFALRDTAADSEMDKRKRRKVARAVKLLNLMASDDRAFHAYLEEQSVALAKEGQAPVDPFRPAQTQVEPADDMDALLTPPPPAVGTVDFERLKAELMEQCIHDISAMISPSFTLLFWSMDQLPPHLVRLVMSRGGARPYIPSERDSVAMQTADRLLSQVTTIIYIEVYEDRLHLVSEDGSARWMNL